MPRRPLVIVAGIAILSCSLLLLVQLRDSTEDPPLHGKATKAASDPLSARVDAVAEQQGVVKEAREDPPEGSVPPKLLQVAQSGDVRPAEKTPEGEDGAKSCHFQPIESPLSGLEMEIIRIWNISAAVMAEIGATYWPTDGTLLGLMRNGRVATDRDIDLQIHTTKDKCAGLLNSLKPLFAKRCELQSFKVVNVKKGSKIGRYAMVRMHRKFGTFSTGVDFNCVYFDIPDQPHFYTHKGEYTRVPPAVYPLGKCLFYGQEVPCPKDGYAVLEALKPRYEGCMVFPHCIGDPTVSTSKCLSPHPVIPLKRFVETTTQLAECGYTSLRDHFKRESSCQQMLEQADQLSIRNCETHNGKKICFIQSFKG